MNMLFEIDGLPPHLVDLAHIDEAAVERGVEQRKPVGAFLDLIARARAREDQHRVGDLRGRGPDLGALQHIAPVLLLGAGLDRAGVEPGIGLGDGEARLDPACRERRQHAALLRIRAEAHDRVEPENIHVDRGRARHGGARLRDRAHHHRRLGDAEAGAAMLFRDADAEPAARGDRRVEFVRKDAVMVAAQPIVVVEAGADAPDRVLDFPLRR